MTRHSPTLNRRHAVVGGLAALTVGITRPRLTSARAIIQRGVAGGGVVQIDGGTDANVSVFASAIQIPDADQQLFVGRVQWVETDSGLVLESTKITACIVMKGREDGREVRGEMSVNGGGNYPFVLQVIDAGPPGAGVDAITLDVGGAVESDDATPTEGRRGFSYSAGGAIVGGDFQNLSIDADIADPKD